ncbi:GntR family transcriptional regulator, partial [Streptomyces sp. NPDC001215]
MTLKIRIGGSAPPYEQVRAQISEQARSGVLPVGYRLPTVRGLAEALGLAANTVVSLSPAHSPYASACPLRTA